MLINEVMDELGVALSTIEGLRVFPYWADRVSPPAAVVGWPDPLDYDTAMTRGGDQIDLPVIVMVGKVDSRTARNEIARFAAGSGADSVKAAVESHEPISYDSARVTRCEFGVISVGAVEYLAATFQINISGPGKVQ